MKNISVQIATRVQSYIRDAIQAQALAEHRTISQQTAKILSEYVHTQQNHERIGMKAADVS